MKANERAMLASCIDTGICAGWNRAHKHTDAPHELRIQEEIDNAIWYEIDQYFVFDSERNLCDEVVEGFDRLESERESAQSAEIDVELIEEHDDGSATYRFNMTEKHANALLQNGILWAIVSGATGVTIDKVLQDHAKNDDHINLAYELGYELGYEAAKHELSSKT
jgi:hypothetical protein